MDTSYQPEAGRRLPTRARNPRTAARFRRQSWWQITFPVLVVAILMIGCAAGLFTMTGLSGLSVVADYSVILLSLPALIIGLIVLIVTVLLTYLVMILLGRIPPYTFVAYRYFDRVHRAVVGVMNTITGAVIGFLSVISGVSLFLKRFSEEHAAGPSGPPEQGAGLD